VLAPLAARKVPAVRAAEAMRTGTQIFSNTNPAISTLKTAKSVLAVLSVVLGLTLAGERSYAPPAILTLALTEGFLTPGAGVA